MYYGQEPGGEKQNTTSGSSCLINGSTGAGNKIRSAGRGLDPRATAWLAATGGGCAHARGVGARLRAPSGPRNTLHTDPSANSQSEAVLREVSNSSSAFPEDPTAVLMLQDSPAALVP